MNLSLCVLFFCIAVSCLTTVSANENANSKKGRGARKLSYETSDDEDAVDGSGDFTESSGSGLPPDDDVEHTHKNLKPEVRNGDDTIPFPATTAKTTTTPPPVPKPAPEPPPFDVNPKPKPAEPTQNENKDVHPDENYDLTESKNRAMIPKKTTEEERTHDRLPGDKIVEDNKSDTNGVYKVNNPDRDRTTSFFSQPGILAAIIGGAVVGLLCAILVVMFIVYRMRKKDEGSYPLEEMKRCPASNPYMKPAHREFFA